MDAHFNEGLGFAENKSDLPFNQHRVERKLARALSKEPQRRSTQAKQMNKRQLSSKA